MFNLFKTVLRSVRSIFAKKSQNPDDSQRATQIGQRPEMMNVSDGIDKLIHNTMRERRFRLDHSDKIYDPAGAEGLKEGDLPKDLYVTPTERHPLISGPSFVGMRFRQFRSLTKVDREAVIHQAYNVYKRIRLAAANFDIDGEFLEDDYDESSLLGPAVLQDVVRDAMYHSSATTASTSATIKRMEATSIPRLTRQAAQAGTAIMPLTRANYNRDANDPKPAKAVHDRSLWHAVLVLTHVRNIVEQMEREIHLTPEDERVFSNHTCFTLFTMVLFDLLVVTEDTQDLQSTIARSVEIFGMVTETEPDIDRIKTIVDGNVLKNNDDPTYPYYIAVRIVQEVMLSVQTVDDE